MSPPARSGSPVWLVPPGEEADLVARCRAREPAAFRALFERERLRLHRLMYHLIGSNTHIDDLLQDTFLEVFCLRCKAALSRKSRPS
jgi:DNA-directed RNA polymerase specialized sigma24 family protein